MHDADTQAGAIDPRDRFPEIDLALIQCPISVEQVLPIEVDFEEVEEFLSKGFQRQGSGIRDALPVDGHISGRTRISYQVESRYDIDGALVLTGSDKFDHGLSGAHYR